MSQHFGHGFVVTELIAAVFHNNWALCSAPHNAGAVRAVVTRFLELISVEGAAYGSRFVQLFMSLMRCGGSVVRRNQETVLGLITEAKPPKAGSSDGGGGGSSGGGSGGGSRGKGKSRSASAAADEELLMRNEILLLYSTLLEWRFNQTCGRSLSRNGF